MHTRLKDYLVEELNNAKSVVTIECPENMWDTVTITDNNDAIHISQYDEEGDVHDVILSPDMAEKLMRVLAGILG